MKFPALNISVEPQVEGFFDSTSNTTSCMVKDPASQACAMVDSVLDIDYAAGRITYDSVDRQLTRSKSANSMHQRAHRFCFIADSPTDGVKINIVQEPAKV